MDAEVVSATVKQVMRSESYFDLGRGQVCRLGHVCLCSTGRHNPNCVVVSNLYEEYEMKQLRLSNAFSPAKTTTSNSRARIRTSAMIAAFAFVVYASVFPGSLYAGAAPPLTSMVVVAVASPAYKGGTQWDYIPANALTTTNDHGGDWICVAVLETGYGTAQNAAFNNTTMSLYRSDPVPATGVTTGFIRYYSLNKTFTSGRFTNQAKSMNSPWNTISTGLNVK